MFNYMFLGVFSLLKDAIIVPLFLIIDAKIYGLIAKVYELFMKLAQAKIFTNELYQNISEKVYVLIGVVALFLLAYSLLLAVVNPDNALKGDNSGGQIVKRLVISLVLISLVPTIFDFLYEFQGSVLSYGTINKFLLGTQAQDIPDKVTVEFQDENGKYLFEEGCTATTYEEALQICEVAKTEYDTNNLSNSFGYNLSFTILNAFLHPVPTIDPSTWNVNASDIFGVDTGISWSLAGCAIGAVALAAVAVAGVIATEGTGAAVIVPAVKAVGAAIFPGCFAGGLAGLGAHGAAMTITYDKYTWAMAQYEILLTGDFDKIVPFSQAIAEGNMDYMLIVSTVCGGIVLYMLISFCLDIGLRAAKLAFYEMVAPVCLFLSIVPNNKSVLTNWLKATLTTWAEVFVRVFSLCIVVLLFAQIDDTVIKELGLLAGAIVAMGLVMFAKQFPKLLGEVTGIKSENMKLGIMDKLKDGGALVAGSVIGGGLLTGARNLTKGGANVINRWKRDTNNGVGGWRRFGHAVAGVASTLGSTGAGGLSGGLRSFKGGLGAKSFSDMFKASGEGAKKATEARDKRANYKAKHEIPGRKGWDRLMDPVMGAHISDAVTQLGGFLGIGNIEQLKRDNAAMDQITSARDTLDQSADQLILKEVSKGSKNLTGISLDDVIAKKNAYEQARMSGVGNVVSLEADYNNALRAARGQLINKVSVSRANWDALSADDRAKLSGLRVDAVNYRGAISNNAAMPALQDAGIVGANFGDEYDVIITNPDGSDVANIDMMNKQIKLHKGNNNVAIATANQQKTDDSKK